MAIDLFSATEDYQRKIAAKLDQAALLESGVKQKESSLSRLRALLREKEAAQKEEEAKESLLSARLLRAYNDASLLAKREAVASLLCSHAEQTNAAGKLLAAQVAAREEGRARQLALLRVEEEEHVRRMLKYDARMDAAASRTSSHLASLADAEAAKARADAEIETLRSKLEAAQAEICAQEAKNDAVDSKLTLVSSHLDAMMRSRDEMLRAAHDAKAETAKLEAEAAAVEKEVAAKKAEMGHLALLLHQRNVEESARARRAAHSGSATLAGGAGGGGTFGFPRGSGGGGR